MLPEAHRARPRLEALEDRWLPAVVVWTGAVNQFWNVASNWSTHAVPHAGDDVVINRPSDSVTINTDVRVRSLTSAGSVLLRNRTLDAGNGSSVARLTIDGGDLVLHRRFEVTERLNWRDGEISGNGTLTVSGAAWISSGGGRTLTDATVETTGVTTWDGGRVASNDGQFVNRGSFTVTTSSRFEPDLTNFGQVTIDVARTVTFETVTNAGVVSLQGGKLSTVAYTQTAGQTRLEGGALSSNRTIQLRGGWLGGGGTVQGSLNNSGGVVAPHLTDGAPHTLRIQGSYTQSGAARLALLDTGPAAAASHDTVQVTGRAALGGVLNVVQSGPLQVDKVFSGLVADRRTGAFQSVSLTSLAGATLAVRYTGTEVQIVSAQNGPQPNSPGQSSSANTVAAAVASVLVTVVSTSPTGSSTTAGPAGTLPGAREGPTRSADTSSAEPGGASPSDVQVTAAPEQMEDGGSVRFAGLTLNGYLTASSGSSLHQVAPRTAADPAITADGVLPGRPVPLLPLLAGDRKGAGWSTGESGEETPFSFPVTLPEPDPPSENGLATASDLAAELLGGAPARANILPQGGSQLSVVAALVSPEKSTTEEVEATAPLEELYLNPLSHGVGDTGSRGPAAGPEAAPEARDDEARAATPGPACAVPFLATLAVLAGRVSWPRCRQRVLAVLGK